jgi:O-acetyl-ADP-ribose deacetylase
LKVKIVSGDITGQKVDAIVNAANSTLLGGGGVDGAIHSRGGPDILKACRRVRRKQFPQGMPAGRACITTGGRLRAQYVIHTVGPRWHEDEDQDVTLMSCYHEALKLASAEGLDTVAFPAIGAGVYGWPADVAATIAITAVMTSPYRVGEVRFVLFTEEMLEAFTRAASG